MTEISVGFTIVIPGSVDPGMHFGLEVKRLKMLIKVRLSSVTVRTQLLILEQSASQSL